MATGQHVRYVVDVSDNLYPSLVRDERAAQSLEKSLGGINSQIRNIAGAVGVGFGLHALFAGSKEWIKDVSELEVGLLRVKNASADLATGIKNQLFIQDEVKNFKVGLQETVDAYGSFLFKIKNANLGNDVQNRLYENLMMVSKTAALPQSEMDATVRNVGIMLGEGVLEARHLRGLSYVHPQIVPFLAEAIGLKSGEADAFTKILKDRDESDSASQKLSQLISSGKLTKAALPANVIIEAFEAYRKSIEGGLPETLLTIESATNELSNSWLDLKNTIVMELKPEIIDLFKNLQEGIQWLKENKDGIISIGSAVVTLTKLWVEYRVAMGLVNVANAAYVAFMEGQTGAAAAQVTMIEAQTAAYAEQTIAVNALTAAIERQMAIAAGGSGLVGYGGMAAAGTGAAMRGGAAAAAGLSMTGVGIVVATLLIGNEFLKKISEAVPNPTHDELQLRLLEDIANNTAISGAGKWGLSQGGKNVMRGDMTWDEWVELNKMGADSSAVIPGIGIVPDLHYNKGADARAAALLAAKSGKKDTKIGAGGKIVPADDRAIGQRVITYNITINGGLNGQKIDTQNVSNGSDIDMKVITEKVAQSLEAVMNDTQLHSD